MTIDVTSFGANKGLDLAYFTSGGQHLHINFPGDFGRFSFFNQGNIINNDEGVRLEFNGSFQDNGQDLSNPNVPNLAGVVNSINIFDLQHGQMLLSITGLQMGIYPLVSALAGFSDLTTVLHNGLAGGLQYTGSAADEKFTSGDGPDTFTSNGGFDTLAGGGGNDLYYVDSEHTVVQEYPAGGADTVMASDSYFLPDFNDPGVNGGYGIDDLVLTGSAYKGFGNVLDNHITGDDVDNILTGLSGADTIHGMGGNDSIDGGSATNDPGKDQLFGDDGNDTLLGGGGDDSLDGGANDDSLDGSVGNDTLLGGFGMDTLVAGAGTDSLNGGDGSDSLDGGDNNDNLDGGAGVDTMVGGNGNDHYYVDETADVIVEGNEPKGIDTVYTTATYTLSPYIEILYLLTKDPIDGTGNDQDNLIYGNPNNNVITALGGNDYIDGGGGSDSLIGGTGNDTYIAHSHFDEITEKYDEGHDVVLAGGSYTLSSDIEDLTLTGHDSINGTGNDISNLITGNDNDNILDGAGGIDTMVGGAGNDVYGVDDSADVVTELASQGTDYVFSSASFTLPGNVENLVLTGPGDIDGSGNTLANAISGNNQNNIIDGKTGADFMSGMDGDDTYYVDNVGDTVVEGADKGDDLVKSTISYVLPTNVDDLTLLGTAGISGTGNALDNVINGNSGNNLLNGLAGTDTMAGGGGNDSYIADSSTDVVTEFAEQGVDLVTASANYTLSSNIEKLTLTGSANLNGTGNDLANTITGNTGNNVLDGGASRIIRGPTIIVAGNDTMIGGLGDDSFLAHHSGDVIKELLNQGIDLVAIDGSFTLPSNVENLELLGESGINGTGNTLANGILGNSNNNVIDGKAGADTMGGQQGDDLYVVDNAGDLVIEKLDAGHDTVNSSVSYTLASNIEDLVLIAGGPINGTGNDLDNHITGGGGNNILNGGGGADTLMGGFGNDVYIVDSADDQVLENDTNGGTDTVRASLSWTLGANFETLSLTGSSAIDGTGNDLNNSLAGNAAANSLDGGHGADTMAGGLGDDIYHVDNAADLVVETGAGIDTVHTTLNAYTLTANVEALHFDGIGDFAGTGNAGSNSLFGGDGNDTLDGKAGADLMTGGLGDDTYIIDNAGDVIADTDGNDTLKTSVSYALGGAAIETMLATGTASINLSGNGLDNVITGNSGNNSLSGGAGADTLSGGLGNDKLSGGTGADQLIGGPGIDQLTGGGDADTFVFQRLTDLTTTGTLETITDFHHAEGDKIDLSGIDADVGQPGDQAFSFAGTRGLVHAGDVAYIFSHNVVTVYGDVDGDHVADFAITLAGVTSVAADDFIL